MGQFKVLQHTRLPIIGFPWGVIASSKHNQSIHMESFVFLIDDKGNVTQSARRELDFPLVSENGDDLSAMIDEELVLDQAREFVEISISDWQRSEYESRDAFHLLTPLSVSEVRKEGRPLLYRLWIGGCAASEISDIRSRTQCTELKEVLDETVRLPQLDSLR